MSSSRVKRLLRKIENIRGRENKKRRISGSDEECSKASNKLWTPKSLGDFPTSNIYNSTSRSPPAELFRKDLISAMKLPDSEPLTPEDYWLISDTWKQEWERGVQVPVNPEALPVPSVRVTRKKDKSVDFKLPKKLIRITHDEYFCNELHQMSNAPSQAETACRYDLDDCDLQWLIAVNTKRQSFGLAAIEESVMELAMEELETQCYENIQVAINSESGLGIEYDEDVICDVCRSPDSEEGNEMVFCDSCDICVHQACYGIMEIPAGSWLCRTCALCIKPDCIFCPNKGGAMKPTSTGQKWAHVSCALWIPECSIGYVEKMEPITKIQNIPPSRWSLICCVCRERNGACIQCSVKTCKTAYHVTCGFQNGLDMKAVVEDESDVDGVKLRSYCPKHSKSRSTTSDSEGDDDSKNNSTSDDKSGARAKRLEQIEAAFYKYVKPAEIAANVDVKMDVIDFIYQYWKLKRSTGFNKPLLIPKSGENDALGQEQEDSLYAKMKMFVHVRQDLERVRNLCYMVNRREKLSRNWCTMREQLFHKQVAVLTDSSLKLSEKERNSIIHSCHGRNMYDKLYAFDAKCCASVTNVKNEMGNQTPADGLDDCAIGTSKEHQVKSNRITGERLPNPYAKTYNNGAHLRHQRKSSSYDHVAKVGSEPAKDSAKKESEESDTAATSKRAGRSPNSTSTFDENEVTTSTLATKSTETAIKIENILESKEEEEERNQDKIIEEKPSEQVNHSRRGAFRNISAVEDKVEQERINEEKTDEIPCHVDEAPDERDKQISAFMSKCTEDEEKSSKVCLRNGCHSAKLLENKVKAEDEEPSEMSSPVKETSDQSLSALNTSVRDKSTKENVQKIEGSHPVPKPDKKCIEQDTVKADSGGGLNNNNQRWSRQRKGNQKLNQSSNNKMNLEKLAKEKAAKNNSGGGNNVTPFRDKLRQESAKLHESLFSNNMKGSLVGYRIPKKSRSESESEAKQDEEQQQHSSPRSPQLPTQQQLVLSPTAVKKPFETTPPVPPPLMLSMPTPLLSLPTQSPPIAPPWNSSAMGNTNHSLPPTSPLFSPPPKRPPHLNFERRITRRDKQLHRHGGGGSDPSSLPPTPQQQQPPPPPPRTPSVQMMNGGRQDNHGCSPRLIIKLRKDPNYPESPRWRRDSDIMIDNLYEFKCEQSESPSNHIRLKLDRKYDRRHPQPRYTPPQQQQPPLLPELQSNSGKRSKYSMRTRMNMENSSSSHSNYS